MATCAGCGAAVPADSPEERPELLAWSRELNSRGEQAWVCPACTRANVRAIEAKLDRDWW